MVILISIHIVKIKLNYIFINITPIKKYNLLTGHKNINKLSKLYLTQKITHFPRPFVFCCRKFIVESCPFFRPKIRSWIPQQLGRRCYRINANGRSLHAFEWFRFMEFQGILSFFKCIFSVVWHTFFAVYFVNPISEYL